MEGYALAKMTSRQRVRAVLNGEIPDRVPIDFGGSQTTGIHMDAYIDLARYLGIDAEPPKVYEQFQMLARVEGYMRDWFRTDVVELENDSLSWDIVNKDWKPWVNMAGNTVLMPGGFNPTQDEKGYLYLYDKRGDVCARMAPGSRYFDRFGEPKNLRSFDDDPIAPEDWKKRIPRYTDEELKHLQQRARIIYEYTDYAIFGGFLKGSKLGTTGVFAGYDLEEWFYILVSDPDYANELFHATAEAAVENLKLYLDACGEYMDILMMSTSDYGTQRGPMISPEVFNRVYVPNYRIMNDYVHEHSKVKTFFHSCGSIRTLLNGFIDAHVDAINPVQLSALNMNPKELKEEFGKRIVFWGGGIDTQDVLPNGSVDEVREHVKNNLLTFKEGGNYVFNTVHNIQALVPPQNIEAMLETVMEYGKYE